MNISNDFSNVKTIQEGRLLFNKTFEYLTESFSIEEKNKFNNFNEIFNENLIQYNQKISNENKYENKFCFVLSHFKSYVLAFASFFYAIIYISLLLSYIYSPLLGLILETINFYSTHKLIHMIPSFLLILGDTTNTKFWFKSIGLNGNINICPFKQIAVLFFSGITISRVLTGEGYCFGFAYKSFTSG